MGHRTWGIYQWYGPPKGTTPGVRQWRETSWTRSFLCCHLLEPHCRTSTVQLPCLPPDSLVPCEAEPRAEEVDVSLRFVFLPDEPGLIRGTSEQRSPLSPGLPPSIGQWLGEEKGWAEGLACLPAGINGLAVQQEGFNFQRKLALFNFVWRIYCC